MISCHHVALPVNLDKRLRPMSAPLVFYFILIISKTCSPHSYPIIFFSLFSKKEGGHIHAVPVAPYHTPTVQYCIGERSKQVPLPVTPLFLKVASLEFFCLISTWQATGLENSQHTSTVSNCSERDFQLVPEECYCAIKL